MLENQKWHNQLWWPSWIIDQVNAYKGTTYRLFGPNLVSYLPLLLFFKKKIFKDFKIFNQSEAMVGILDAGQGHKTQFSKRTIQGARASHPSLV